MWCVGTLAKHSHASGAWWHRWCTVTQQITRTVKHAIFCTASNTYIQSECLPDTVTTVNASQTLSPRLTTQSCFLDTGHPPLPMQIAASCMLHIAHGTIHELVSVSPGGEAGVPREDDCPGLVQPVQPARRMRGLWAACWRTLGRNTCGRILGDGWARRMDVGVLREVSWSIRSQGESARLCCCADQAHAVVR
jgi:hypothetical protein